MATPTCRACGSTHLSEAQVGGDAYSELRVTVHRADPEETSVLGIPATRDRLSGTLKARVCGDCGVAELYSPEAADLWAAYSGT